MINRNHEYFSEIPETFYCNNCKEYTSFIFTEDNTLLVHNEVNFICDHCETISTTFYKYKNEKRKFTMPLYKIKNLETFEKTTEGISNFISKKNYIEQNMSYDYELLKDQEGNSNFDNLINLYNHYSEQYGDSDQEFNELHELLDLMPDLIILRCMDELIAFRQIPEINL